MIKRKKRLCAVILTATLVMTGIQMPLGVQQVSAYTEDDAVLQPPDRRRHVLQL